MHITKIAADDVRTPPSLSHPLTDYSRRFRWAQVLPPVGHYVEVIGTVQVVENSIRSIKTVGMGDNLGSSPPLTSYCPPLTDFDGGGI